MGKLFARKSKISMKTFAVLALTATIVAGLPIDQVPQISKAEVGAVAAPVQQSKVSDMVKAAGPQDQSPTPSHNEEQQKSTSGTAPAGAPATGATAEKAPANGATAEKAPANGAAAPNEKTPATGEATQSAGATAEKTPATGAAAPSAGAAAEKTPATGAPAPAAGANAEKTPATGAASPSTGGATVVMAFHKVESGENWDAIAKKYSVSVEDLLTFNDAKDKNSALPAAGSPIRLSKAPTTVANLAGAPPTTCPLFGRCAELKSTIVAPFLVPVWVCEKAATDTCTCLGCFPQWPTNTCGCTTLVN